MTTDEITLAVLAAHGVWDPATRRACEFARTPAPEGRALLRLLMVLEAALDRRLRPGALHRVRNLGHVVHEAEQAIPFRRD